MRQILFILIMVVLTIQSCSYFKSGKNERIIAELKAREDSIRVADSLNKIQAVLIENTRLDSIRKADEAKLASESRYNIIVGSFINPEYAKLQAEKYTGMGYDAKIIKPEGSRFELVSAERSGNFRRAAKRLEAFRDTVQIEAWVYVKK